MIRSKGGREYTEGELQLAVRQERAALTAEHTKLVKRLREIEARFADLDVAESLLEGGL